MAKGDTNDKPSPMTQQSQQNMGQSGIPNPGSNSIMQRAQTIGMVPSTAYAHMTGNPHQMSGQSGYNPGMGIPFMGMQGINNLIMRYPMLAQQGYNGNNNSFVQQNPFANGQMPIMKMPQMNNQPSAASPFQQWQGSAGNGLIHNTTESDGWGGQNLRDMLSKIYNPQPNPNIGPIDYSKTYEDYNRDYHADDRDAVLGGYNKMYDPSRAIIM